MNQEACKKAKRGVIARGRRQFVYVAMLRLTINAERRQRKRRLCKSEKWCRSTFNAKYEDKKRSTTVQRE